MERCELGKKKKKCYWKPNDRRSSRAYSREEEIKTFGVFFCHDDAGMEPEFLENHHCQLFFFRHSNIKYLFDPTGNDESATGAKCCTVA